MSKGWSRIKAALPSLGAEREPLPEVAPALDRVAELACRALETRTAVLWLRDAHHAAVRGQFGSHRPLTRRDLVASALPARLTDAPGPLLVADVGAQPDLARDALLRALGAGSCAAAPLLSSQGEPMGALCVARPEPGEWSASEQAVLEALAAAAAAEAELRVASAARESERKQSARLQEAVAQAFGSVSLELALTDEHGRYVYLNSALVTDPEMRASLLGGTDVEYCALLGWDERIGQRRLKAIRRVARERKLLELEESAGGDDGQPRHYTRFVAPVLDPSGAVRLVLSVSVDISKRKRVEAALRESEARYRHLVEQARDMIYRADLHGHFTYVNPVAKRIMGFATRELIGMHYLELVRPDYRARVQEFYAAQLRDRTRNTYLEFPAVTSHGREIWVAQNVQLVMEEGVLAGVQAVARDITERRRVEIALRAREARNRAIREASLDCIVTITAEDRILEFNPAAEATFGWREAEVLGRRLGELIVPAPDREHHRRALSEYGSPGTGSLVGRHVERTALRADGSEFPIEAAIMPILQEDGTRLFTAVMRDITQRKQAEEQLLRAKEAAEAAVRAKSVLLATVSHEIRTPMHAILGATELLMAAPLDAESSELATILQSNAQALLVLVNAFLDTAKIEAGQLLIEEARFDPRSLLDDVAETLAASAAAKGLELAAWVDPAVPAALLGDAGRIRQVLLNIGSNAVKFTEHGEVAIRAEVRVAQGPEGDRRELLIAVRDTGIGISEEDQARIFEPFAQLSGSGQRSTGTGLGLGISRSLADLMGGRLELESEPGHGSTFQLYLPLRPAEPEDATELPRPRLGGRRVLIAAPPGSVRTMLAGVLRHAGADVAEVASARDGLQLLGPATDNAVVLVDERVPDFDGVEAMLRLLAQRGTGRSSLIVICAHDSTVCAENIPGVSGCLRRPVRPRGLVKAVERASAQRRAPRLPDEPTWHIPIAARPGARILIVDDNREDRPVTARILSAAHFSVDLASSAEEAIRMAGATRYDIILMDVMLPGIDGLAATRAIRAAERSPQGRVPILGFTALSGPDVRERCLAAGMDGCIPKPVGARELVDTLSGVLLGLPVSTFAPSEPAIPHLRVHHAAKPVVVESHIADLVPGFLANRRADAGRILQALEENRLDELRRLGHNMRSSCAGYGFAQMSVLGAQLESAAECGDQARIRELARALQAHLDELTWSVAPAE